MQTGEIAWRVAVGDEVTSNQVVCEVQTATLTEDPADGMVVLEIETHEDGFIAKLLLAEGASAPPDVPIAIICEEQEDIAAFANFRSDAGERVAPGTFAWQAFLKAGMQPRECGK